MQLKLWPFISLFALVLTACGPALGTLPADVADVASPTRAQAPAPTDAPDPAEIPTATATQAPAPAAEPTLAPSPRATPADVELPPGATQFKTDFRPETQVYEEPARS